LERWSPDLFFAKSPIRGQSRLIAQTKSVKTRDREQHLGARSEFAIAPPTPRFGYSKEEFYEDQ
jgi:hypothetical protein